MVINRHQKKSMRQRKQILNDSIRKQIASISIKCQRTLITMLASSQTYEDLYKQKKQNVK